MARKKQTIDAQLATIRGLGLHEVAAAAELGLAVMGVMVATGWVRGRERRRGASSAAATDSGLQEELPRPVGNGSVVTEPGL